MKPSSLLLGAALLCSMPLIQAEEALALSKAQVEALGLRFAPAVVAQAAPGVAWPGQVTLPPDGHELLVAPLPGRVTRIHASASLPVKAGQPLLTLYSPALVQLVQDYQRARAAEDLARQTLAREQRLVREGIGVERRVREAEIALRQASAESRGLAARLGLVGIAPERLPGQGPALAEVTLRAPRDGVVLRLAPTPGGWLEEGEAAAELAYTERRWVEAEVPLEQAAALRPGQRAQVLPGGQEGAVLAVGLTAEAQRQTVQVRIDLGHAGELRPGQRVQARFVTAGPVWRVPKSAVVRLGDQDAVFAQRGEAFVAIPVTPVGGEGETVLVSGPLGADARVVQQGAVALKAAWQARNEAR